MKFLLSEKGKEKVAEDYRLKVVLIKPLILFSKKFNTNPPLNEDFLEKLSKKLSSLKNTKSLKVITEDSEESDNLINQFSYEKIVMAKPLTSQPFPQRCIGFLSL